MKSLKANLNFFRGFHSSGFLCRGSKGYDWYFNQLKADEDAKLLVQQEAALKSKLPPPLTKGHKRARVFMNFHDGHKVLGKVTIELADDYLPITCKNFVNLCTGKNTQSLLSYKGTPVHQILTDIFICGGDVENFDGTGGCSTLGSKLFPDEAFVVKHREGVISMTNSGVNANHSQFFFVLKSSPHLDGRNVAFGEVIKGLDVLKTIGRTLCVRGKPVTKISVSDCGLL